MHLHTLPPVQTRTHWLCRWDKIPKIGFGDWKSANVNRYRCTWKHTYIMEAKWDFHAGLDNSHTLTTRKIKQTHSHAASALTFTPRCTVGSSAKLCSKYTSTYSSKSSGIYYTQPNTRGMHITISHTLWGQLPWPPRNIRGQKASGGVSGHKGASQAHLILHGMEYNLNGRPAETRIRNYRLSRSVLLL